MKTGSKLPIDLLFLLLLASAQTQLKSVSFLLVIPLFLYILLYFWHPLVDYQTLPDQFGKTRLVYLIHLFLLFIMITGAVVVPTVVQIGERIGNLPDESGFSPAYGQMHDGAIQMEAGLAYLSEGKNPYVETYYNTPLRFFGFSGLNRVENPALDYFVYLPGFFVLSYPIFQLAELIPFFFDQRMVYLLAYTGVVFLLPLFAKAPTHKLSLLVVIGLNPLLTGPVIVGMNDVAVMFFLLASFLLLEGKRPYFSASLFAFACALKPSAWFFAPFYLIFLHSYLPQEKRSKQFSRLLMLMVGVGVVIVAPFALWDFQNFVTDVFAYPGGAVEMNYPIRGYTIGVLLVGAGIIEDPLASFPFGMLQLVVGLLTLAILWRYQGRNNTIGMLMICSGLLIFSVGLVSRFFQDNYVGFVLIFILFGFLQNFFSQSPPETMDFQNG